MRYSEIQDYLCRLAEQYKNIVSIVNYGLSYENRNLTLIRISTGANDRKPLIFLDAGIHAREWIAPAQALYVINQLIENSNNRELIENVDWVIVPLTNPDGYEYTHTVDRSWRKNRSRGKMGNGVDLNRNFDLHWLGAGSSKNEHSMFYAGPKSFSEPETLALSSVISKYAKNTKLYLTAHAAAQCLLYPWAYTSKSPENADELRDLGMNVSRKIYNVNKTKYKVGSAAQVLYRAGGSSSDWAYGVANIDLVYIIELPPYLQAHHKHRYEMPPKKIFKVVSEMFEGIKVFHDYVEEKYG